MKILLCVPPLSFKTRSQTGHARFIPHLGLAYIGAALKSKGYDVRVCDAAAEGLTLQSVGGFIKGYNPDIVGITGFTSQIYEAHEVARIAKSINKNILTLVGGNHASALPEETLREFGEFDVAVAGEGEETVVELVHFFSGEKIIDDSIRGIAYRKDNTVRLNSPRPPVENLDEIVFPSFDIFRLNRYRAVNALFGAKRTLPVLASRGCSYKCCFCFRIFGNTVRFRTIDNVIEEIKRDINEFGIQQVFFQDETFTIDRERTVVFCQRMLREGLQKKTTWVCETRVDAVDKEMLGLMRKAGCTLISYGIESGSQHILDKIRKDISLERAQEAVRVTRESRIRVYTNFMLGHPFETRDTLFETMSFMRKLNPDYVSLSILSPFPGTEVRNMAQKQEGGLKLLSMDWRDYGTQFGGALELDGLSRGDLENYQRKAYLSHYFRLSRIWNMLRIIDFNSIPNHIYQFFIKNLIGALGFKKRF